jgi:hypothetical protein
VCDRELPRGGGRHVGVEVPRAKWHLTVRLGEFAMNQEHGLQTRPESQRSPAAARAVMPVLIRVPTLPESLEGSRWRSVRRRPRSRVQKPRRRLRREVRLTGYGLLLSATLTWAAPALRGITPSLFSHPDRAPRIPSSQGAPGVAGLRPTISISIEPAALAPYADAQSPVVFPGYLLPDDGCEEPAHAGT